MQACLTPARVESIQWCLARFKLGRHVSVGLCRRLQGLMVAASSVLPLGLLLMKTIPMVDEVPEYSSLLAVPLPTKNVRRLFPRPFSVVGSQISPEWSTYGVICHRQMIMMDASLSGWGAVFKGRPAYGVWSGKYLTWHINGLELRAVHLALTH